MQYATLGRSDLKVSRVCLGTMTFGTQNSEADAHRQLDFALARDVNFIDTAEMYSVPPNAESYGKTETYIGTWLKRQARDRIVLATKISGPGRGMKWIRNGELAFNRKNIRAAIEGSLRRLQTDYVDLYQLHWPDRNTPLFGQYQFDPEKERDFVPLAETLEALAELVKEGRVRCIGLSNETPWGVMQFVRLAEERNLPRVVSVQNAYSLLNRTWETGLAEIGFRENVGLLAYSPLAFGLLSGKYLADAQTSGRVTLFPGFGQRYSKINVLPAVAAYADLARRHGISLTRLALAFVASRPFVDSTIIGATTMEQLHEDIDGCTGTLPEEVVNEIEALHLRYFNPAP
ncbi:NADP(H)-dependent aldo-keto reductase [Sulfuritalea hydrogenivorans]|uniref:Protein tas n=1 Tax=Sulfuritalea hydrogenivorans sk43H TaxID=1223802 RepID=W0SI71_9PROT|nr:NADP(H)-dependent aldo-keto reductase [Sulfuritalea hydrogenivorans]MDK9714135.1 NADP(H)-dependent aldo-keto reductase [Sulfuritalea sp.]BAO30517.1 aldo/keto reductase [Sulfuritalea hydrogenivorans sk43H]